MTNDGTIRELKFLMGGGMKDDRYVSKMKCKESYCENFEGNLEKSLEDEKFLLEICPYCKHIRLYDKVKGKVIC